MVLQRSGFLFGKYFFLEHCSKSFVWGVGRLIDQKSETDCTTWVCQDWKNPNEFQENREYFAVNNTVLSYIFRCLKFKKNVIPLDIN